MVKVKSVKIDGDDIHYFNTAIYIFESSSGYTLELGMVVSEVVLRKYKNEENLILEIELQDGRVFNTIMHPQGMSGGLPQLHLYCPLNDIEDYQDFQLVKENDFSFPKIDEGITLEEIRKYEMPNEKVNLKLNLPIDQSEWLAKQKKGNIDKIFKEAIYDYWKKQSTNSQFN
ncbi:hypothetical protein RCG23_02610 [Neobacillus sp. PS3-34]|uniref:hypothetical protein n=1 Tax=Neobacillus sp. PS3-34 TaxID=3070678 RepID=UPI0027E1C282|nr:hypothetical protein [Neobacillus sp. PS3-34]WML49018.1 hypothetical protein RCG23_02610 [Neobacillus sp. PS3-34]